MASTINPSSSTGTPQTRSAERLEQPSRRAVAGILDGHPIAGRGEDTGNKVDRLLGTVGDDDVVRVRAYAARDTDVMGDCFAQVDVPGGMTIGVADRGRAKLACEQTAPGLVREQPRIGNAGTEIEPGGAPHREGERHILPRPARPQRRRTRPPMRRGGWQVRVTYVPEPTLAVAKPSPIRRS